LFAIFFYSVLCLIGCKITRNFVNRKAFPQFFVDLSYLLAPVQRVTNNNKITPFCEFYYPFIADSPKSFVILKPKLLTNMEQIAQSNWSQSQN